jgi:hypothetical protein
MPLSERTKLEQDKSLFHDKMKEAWYDLSNAVSKFHALEDYYDLDELTIERVDGWTDRINKSLTDAEYLIDELEDWAFDGDSYRLMEDAEDEN